MSAGSAAIGGGLPAWVPELADGLASGLRELVLPHLGLASARGLAGRATGGDTTFTIDEKAEVFIGRFLAEQPRRVAVYSEDRGYSEWGGVPGRSSGAAVGGMAGTPTGTVAGVSAPTGRAEYVLIVDPIDGTRPAAAGFEAACVSVAVARMAERPTMADVVYGVVHEIKEGGVFRAARGQGVEVRGPDGRERPVAISQNTDLSRLFWTVGFRGRPAAELPAALGGLIDRSSVDGAVFDIGSATYSMTRILTGQLDAYVDVGPLMIELAPWVERRFREVGKGYVLNNSPYDVAASTLILQEARCLVSDAAGRPLAGRPLLGSDMAYQMSVVASAGASLHEAILQEVARGMEAFVAAGPPPPSDGGPAPLAAVGTPPITAAGRAAADPPSAERASR